MTDYKIINGEKVPVIKCDSEITISNVKTGKIYKNEEEVKADKVDPKDINEKYIEKVSKMSAAPAFEPVPLVFKLDLKAFVIELSALAKYFLIAII